MDIQAFKDASTRLNPLRKMLADLETVSETVVGIFQQRKEVEAAVSFLQDKYNALQTDITNLEISKKEAAARFIEAQRAAEIKLADLENQADERKVELRAQVAQAQLDAAKQIQSTEAATKQALQDLFQQRRDAEEAVARTQVYLREISAQLKLIV